MGLRSYLGEVKDFVKDEHNQTQDVLRLWVYPTLHAP